MLSWRCDQAHAIKMCVEAVDRLFAGLGGNAWFADGAPQLLWRDAKMTGAPAFTDHDIAARIHGRRLMGLPADDGLI